MGLYDVPKGVVPQTGILTSVVGLNAQGAASQSGGNHRFDLGPGFVVGIHGWYGSTERPNDATEFYTVQVMVEAGHGVTLALPDTRVAFTRTPIVDGAVLAGLIVQDEGWDVVLPAPILSVQDWSSVGNNNLDTVGHWMSGLRYSIYTADDVSFLRLAGISLSRG